MIKNVRKPRCSISSMTGSSTNLCTSRSPPFFTILFQPCALPLETVRQQINHRSSSACIGKSPSESTPPRAKLSCPGLRLLERPKHPELISWIDDRHFRIIANNEKAITAFEGAWNFNQIASIVRQVRVSLLIMFGSSGL
jgi:hypothetical protein